MQVSHSWKSMLRVGRDQWAVEVLHLFLWFCSSYFRSPQNSSIRITFRESFKFSTWRITISCFQLFQLPSPTQTSMPPEMVVQFFNHPIVSNGTVIYLENWKCLTSMRKSLLQWQPSCHKSPVIGMNRRELGRFSNVPCPRLSRFSELCARRSTFPNRFLLAVRARWENVNI